jgi:TolA-binding protein
MSNSVKIALYVALALVASVSGYFALTNFGRMMARAGQRNSELEQIEPERKPPPDTPDTSVPESSGTNAAVTNASSALSTNSSNVLVGATNQAAVASATTNPPAPAVSNKTALTSAKGLRSIASAKAKAESGGHIGVWAALFVASLIGLGLLIANDVSHYFGSKALKVLYNDEGAGEKAPEYDKAEELWANGEHLEAIKMMREYLQKNPREQHVAIRIAEIYEKDLKNNLAAALEYEEVLKHKLAPERWGWAAIHLCNLYFHLSQEQKGYDLLRRIVNEYPGTQAADKARKRLEQVDESVSTEQMLTESHVSAAPRTASKPEAAPAASNLPPGFRPKK